MKVMVIPVDAPPTVEDVEPRLEAYQAIVGGYIQAVPLAAGFGPASLYCDEEGKSKPEAKVNAFATRIASLFQGDCIVGPVVVTGEPDAQGADTPVTDETVAAIEDFARGFDFPAVA